MGMLLAVDIGNTLVSLGLHDGDRWQERWRIRTVPDKTPEEYAVLVRQLVGTQRPGRLVLVSVVPSLTAVFREVGERWLGSPVLVVEPGVKTGLAIRTDHPSEVGADLVAAGVAAYARFSEACIAVEFATATSFVAVVPPGALVGVALAPGVRSGADALAGLAAQLPRVPLASPSSALGRNTVAAMQAGVVLGHAGLVDGLIRRMRDELGPARTVATGIWADLVAPHCAEIEIVDPWLTLEGLRLISLRNA